MKPVFQTMMGADGNCFSACLASLMELSIDEVPNFFHTAGHESAAWWGAVRDWLRPRGLGVMSLQLNDAQLLQEFEGWFIVSGEGPRGVHHATIWHGGVMVHDPHPSGLGLSRPEVVDLLYPLNPAALAPRL